MNEISRKLGSKGVWYYFSLICATPHPSGKEQYLAQLLAAEARSRDLQVRFDHFGNMRIERKAAPGMENRPTVIFQAHLDMVPQKAAGFEFDFSKDPLPVRVQNNRIDCAGKTTLGADDGIGVALAMDILSDQELQCGPLAAVFTLQEEIGLNGARVLAPEFLQGDYLINLDSGDDKCFYAGCAGGVEIFGFFTPEYTKTPEGFPLKISVRGLKGGHSGVEIHQKRGNAHKFLAAFLSESPEILAAASFEGGSAVNAISKESESVVISAVSPEELKRTADVFASELAKNFNAPENFGFDIIACPAPEKVWSEDFRKRFLNAVTALPDGVLEYSSEIDCVCTSCNLGVVTMKSDGRIKLGIHPRAFDDKDWQQVSAAVGNMLRQLGAVVEEHSPYPGWKFKSDSRLLKEAGKVYEKVYGSKPDIKAVHAGLEPGLFTTMAPELEMISFAPECGNEHTTEEFLLIDSTEKVAFWLRELVKSL
ncbi:MAG: beta-Ala-His dipeptidase [Lentisphaeria bacterium]|nr:beta-Ala-His dipeptidase [Lentisphaeria bacterium]